MTFSLFGIDPDETLEERYEKQESQIAHGREGLKKKVRARNVGWGEFNRDCIKWYRYYPRAQKMLREQVKSEGRVDTPWEREWGQLNCHWQKLGEYK